MNMFALTCTLYQMCAKIATRQHTVNVIDLCLFRTAVNLLLAVIIVRLCKQKVVEGVPIEHRRILLFRCFCGLVGFTTLVYSVELLPLFIV